MANPINPWKILLPDLSLKAWDPSCLRQMNRRTLSNPVPNVQWKHNQSVKLVILIWAKVHLKGGTKGDWGILDVHQDWQDCLGRAGIVDNLDRAFWVLNLFTVKSNIQKMNEDLLGKEDAFEPAVLNNTPWRFLLSGPFEKEDQPGFCFWYYGKWLSILIL